MSEELIQRDLIANPERMGDWYFYNIGSTTLRALKTAGIIAKRDYGRFEGKKPDALVVQKPNVIAAVEYKTPQELRTDSDKQKAIGQEIGVARALGAKMYIVTDGQKSYWLNPATGNEILHADESPVSANFDKEDPSCIALMRRIALSVDSKCDRIVENATVDPLPLAEQVWQDLWAVSGASPVNCLYTFVEVFIFKYLSDLGVLSGESSFNALFGKYTHASEIDVLDIYVKFIRTKIKKLFKESQRDGTTVINGSIFVDKDNKPIEGYAATFKNILMRFERFGSLEYIDFDFKSKLFETLLKESKSKKNWGQYFTPLCVVRSIVDMADVRPGMRICDPACGVGKFLLEPLLDNPRLVKVEDDEVSLAVDLVGYDKGFDKEEQKTIILAKANMLIYLSSYIRARPDLTDQFSRLLNDTFLLQTNSILGTLARPEVEQYDLILTNPPYVMSGSSNLKKEIAAHEELKAHYTVNAMGVEGLFMEWIVRALKPGGKAFVVVPDGVMHRKNDKLLRDFILERCFVDAVISLPLNTFFTTSKKTYILALTKKPAAECGSASDNRQITPVLTYLCSEIGETRDMYRFSIKQNDLETASNAFKVFQAVGSSIPYDDPRCKIVDFDDFELSDHWCVDRWWTREERIALGVEDELQEVGISEFVDYLGALATTVSELQEQLRKTEKKNSEIRLTKRVSLGDPSLFHMISNALGENKKALVEMNCGEGKGVPVYTASPNPVAWLLPARAGNKVIAASPEHPLLSFATNGDGSAGKNFVFHDQPFFINADRLAIDVQSGIDVRFLFSQLYDMKKKYGFGHAYKANRRNAANVEVEVPVDERGNFDLFAQKNVAREFFKYLESVSELKRAKRDMAGIDIAMDYEGENITWHRLGDLFNFERGVSRYTKAYGNTHPGSYPVYSASQSEPLTYIDTFDYEGEYLSWSTNGFAGTMRVLKGCFSINGDRAVMVLKDGVEGLNLDYLKFVLQPIFRAMAKGRKGDKGTNEFTKLHPSMVGAVLVPIPVTGSGVFDLRVQGECAWAKAEAENAKSQLMNQIDEVINLTVDVIK